MDLLNACEDADAIVYHPGAGIGHFVAKSKDISTSLGSPFPILETDEYRAFLFYARKIPRFLYRLTHKMFLEGFWMATKKPLQILARQRPDTLPRKLKNPLKQNDYKLISCSKAVFVTPEPGISAGFWFLEHVEYRPSDALVAFLASGEAPLYFGFGSVGAAKDARETTRIIVQAVEQTGTRAILATGFGGLDHDSAHGPNVFTLSVAPHNWLFPRMSVLVHHGGAGTTAVADYIAKVLRKE